MAKHPRRSPRNPQGYLHELVHLGELTFGRVRGLGAARSRAFSFYGRPISRTCRMERVRPQLAKLVSIASVRSSRVKGLLTYWLKPASRKSSRSPGIA